MYVCVCNAVTEDDVRDCLAHGGSRSAKDVKAACGMLPGCGSCTKRLHAMVSEHRTASELVDALTGGPAPLELAPELPREVPVGDTPMIELERGSAPQTAA
ncbi:MULTISPECIES: (2Fe-2S)-binding protein [Thermomonosporaceae]|uniref:(2Fe-2S)-binding protein n=1 Tax=Thermomonosporaceae TaxID=2012 RepID=UPI00255AEC4B|nr:MULTISPECIES: (2Fe-2S)-binding protein [Thermomonosporaceae]MDL4776101.1 (2Fe-2S)-binding protein [Actinomadura xylanilytica]